MEDINSPKIISDTSLPKLLWWQDLSFWSLLLSNVITIILIIKDRTPIGTILLIYWMQSVMIGIFNFVRILCLKNFSTKNLYSNGKQVPETTSGKTKTAFFFAFHYGFFHLIYFAFITSLTDSHSFLTDYRSIFTFAGIFFFNHLFSFVYNFEKLTNGGNLGNILFTPYLRIVPMHLILGVAIKFGQGAIIPFLLIKSAIDLISHKLKHGLADLQNLKALKGVTDSTNNIAINIIKKLFSVKGPAK